MDKEPTNDEFLSNLSFGEFDIQKFGNVLKRKWPYLLVIFLVCNLAAYLTIRYTKPLYRSQSELKLDIKSEAAVLGFPNGEESSNRASLSSEIELLKSKLFLTRVAEALDMDLSVFAYGKVMVDERYPSFPFTIDYQVLNTQIMDRPVDVHIEDENEYTLSYSIGGRTHLGTYRFGRNYNTEDLRFNLHLNLGQAGSANPDGYFFRINSLGSVVRYLESNLSVKPTNLQANIINVSFTDHNANKARDMITVIDTMYLNYTESQKNKANQQKINFLDEQLERNESRLSEIESYFEEFTVSNRTVNLKDDIKQSIELLNNLDSSRYYLNQSLEDLRRIETLIISDSIQYTYLFDTRQLNSVIFNRLQEYVDLLETVKLLRRSYNENTRALTSKTDELSMLKQQLLNYLALQRKEIQKDLARVYRQRNRIEKEFELLPSKSNQFSKIERYYSLYENFNLSLMQRKTELEIAQAGMVTDFKILSPASSPGSPISPDTFMIYGLGVSVSLILMLGFTVFAYLLDNKIHTSKDLERLTSVPILGTMPVHTENLKGASLVIRHDTKSLLAESLRSIRTNLDFLNVGDGPKIISVTSTVSGEGKTFTAVNLGAVLSLAKEKVVVIDMDMRKPKVHYAFGEVAHAQRGLSTYLIKRNTLDEVIFKSDLDNLEYIPSGPIPPNPAELIVNGAFEGLIQELNQKYDYVIMDTPPVGLVTDALLAMKRSNISLYVVRADYSQQSFAQNINKIGKLSNIKNLYLLVNSTSPKHSTYGSSPYYEDTKKRGIKRWFN